MSPVVWTVDIRGGAPDGSISGKVTANLDRTLDEFAGQFPPGATIYEIAGESVSGEEFRRQAKLVSSEDSDFVVRGIGGSQILGGVRVVTV